MWTELSDPVAMVTGVAPSVTDELSFCGLGGDRDVVLGGVILMVVSAIVETLAGHVVVVLIVVILRECDVGGVLTEVRFS